MIRHSQMTVMGLLYIIPVDMWKACHQYQMTHCVVKHQGLVDGGVRASFRLMKEHGSLLTKVFVIVSANACLDGGCLLKVLHCE